MKLKRQKFEKVRAQTISEDQGVLTEQADTQTNIGMQQEKYVRKSSPFLLNLLIKFSPKSVDTEAEKDESRLSFANKDYIPTFQEGEFILQSEVYI